MHGQDGGSVGDIDDEMAQRAMDNFGAFILGRNMFGPVRGEWVDPWSAGIVDPLPVVEKALEAGVSAAMIALTGEVLIRRKKPPRSVEP